MRIAIVHSFYSEDSPSGENIVVRSQHEALSRAGHETMLIYRSTDSERLRATYQLRAAATAAGFGGHSPEDDLSKFRPDIIHVHNLFPNWSGSWMSGHSDRIVTTLHNFRPICAKAILWRDGSDCTECLENGSTRAIKHRCYRDSAIATLPLAWSSRNAGSHSPLLTHSKLLIVLNERAKAVYQRAVPGVEVRTIPNFAAQEASSHTAPGDSYAYVGRLTTEKGIDWLLRNWPHEKQLRIVGDGPLRDVVAASAAEFPNTFSFVGLIDPKRARRELAAAKALVLPSLWSEGIPTVALEAMQAGTPVMASRLCASAESLTKGGAGVVFDADSAGASIALAIDRVENDRAMRGRAQALYMSDFSEESWLMQTERAYADVLANAPAS